MTDRWRGRIAGLAIIVLLVAGFALATSGLAGIRSASPPVGSPGAEWLLVVRADSGSVLLRVPLPDGRFTLRYRNSVYLSLAEERFAIDADGRIVLIELAADEAAVLDEYYAADRPRQAGPTDTRGWRAAPDAQLALDELPLAATEHGRRTLVVDGRPPIPLWQLAGIGGPMVILDAEKPR